MRPLEQNQPAVVMVFMVDATTKTGLAGLTPVTVQLSKSGGAFAAATPTPTVVDRTGGWYSVALTAAHTDTLGDLVIRCTAAGAETSDRICYVERALVGQPVALAAAGADGINVDGLNLRQAIAICTAAAAGRLSGAETNNPVIRSADNTANRISAVTDADGNRLSVTITPPA